MKMFTWKVADPEYSSTQYIYTKEHYVHHINWHPSDSFQSQNAILENHEVANLYNALK